MKLGERRVIIKHNPCLDFKIRRNKRMKKILLTLLIIFLGIGILSIPTNYVLSQYTQFDLQRMARDFFVKGVLVHNLSYETIDYDDFLVRPDTSSATGGWTIYGGGVIGTTGIGNYVKQDTSGRRWMGSYINRKGEVGILTLGKGNGTMTLQRKSGIFQDTTLVERRKPIEYEVKFAPNDTNSIGYLFGLINYDVDTTYGTSSFAGIYFYKPYGNNKLFLVTKRGGAVPNSDSVTMKNFSIPADTSKWITAKFTIIDTNLVTTVVDGISDSSATKYIPFRHYLLPTFEIVRNDTCQIGYFRLSKVK
jgi:hypothetical protein